jgi:hypothetical protein
MNIPSRFTMAGGPPPTLSQCAWYFRSGSIKDGLNNIVFY